MTDSKLCSLISTAFLIDFTMWCLTWRTECSICVYDCVTEYLCLYVNVLTGALWWWWHGDQSWIDEGQEGGRGRCGGVFANRTADSLMMSNNKKTLFHPFFNWLVLALVGFGCTQSDHQQQLFNPLYWIMMDTISVPSNSSCHHWYCTFTPKLCHRLPLVDRCNWCSYKNILGYDMDKAL